MYSKLFHKDVFIPNNVQEIVKNYQEKFTGYRLSNHLKEHMKGYDDRSHDYLEEALIKCLDTIQQCSQEAFEVELSKDYRYFGKSGWIVTKYCIRIPYCNTQDLVVSIRPFFDQQTKRFDFSKNLIVTAWLNDKNDSHSTLDASKYCSQGEWKSIN